MQIVVVTGMDGAGKTTLIQRLKESIRSKRVDTLHLPFSGFAHDALARSGSGTQMGDTWTDRLIFALDNRLAAYEIRAKADNADVLIMQRGWMDSYIFGAVQGLDYRTITNLVRPAGLPKPACTIYLNCDPDIAYQRIKDDQKADKFETPSFMRKQYTETKRFYDAIDKKSGLKQIFNESRCYLDTTSLTPNDVEVKAMDFLKSHGILDR